MVALWASGSIYSFARWYIDRDKMVDLVILFMCLNGVCGVLQAREVHASGLGTPLVCRVPYWRLILKSCSNS